jgi:V/A-type H+-transporting ATPase subunit D
MSFRGKVQPTKLELIRLKRSLKVARRIHKILEDKKEVLLKKLGEMVDRATEYRKWLETELNNAYSSLLKAYLDLGPMKVESIAMTSPPVVRVEARVKRYIDVNVPVVSLVLKKEGLNYGFADTSKSLDEASKKLASVVPLLIEAASIENAIFKIALELERTQRLMNALEYIIIPQVQDNIKFITMTLEEREREEFIRLKKVKRVLEARRGV